MSIEDKIRSLLESAESATPAQLSYPGATTPQDPAPYGGVGFEELEFDRPGVVTDGVAQFQFPGQTQPDPEPLGPEFQEIDPFDMSAHVAQVPKENYPIGNGADDVQPVQDEAGNAPPDEYSAGIKPAQHPAPFVSGMNEATEPKKEYSTHKAKSISAKSEGRIVVLDKVTASSVEKKLGLPKGALIPQKTAKYGETVVVKGADNKLHTIYSHGEKIRLRPYGHTDHESTEKLETHLSEAVDATWLPTGKKGRDSKNQDGPYDRHEYGEVDANGEWTGKRVWKTKDGKSINEAVDGTWLPTGKKGRDSKNQDGPYDRHEYGEVDANGEWTGKRVWKTKDGKSINEAVDEQPQQDPVDQQNEILQQAVQAVQAGNKIEDVSKATGIDIKTLEGAIDAAQPTKSPAATQSVAPVSESELKNDMASLLSEENFSDAFKTKASGLFEAAVIARVNNETQRIEEAFATKIEQETASLQEQYVKAIEVYAEKQSTRLSNYINYLGEQWIKQNKVSIQQGARTELTEGFMSGLQKLFTEHHINVPEAKMEIVAEQETKIKSLQESIAEMTDKLTKLEESNSKLNRKAVVMKLSEGLTDIDIEKLHSLCEGVEYESADLFESKVSLIKTNFFKRKPSQSPEQLLEDNIQTKQTQLNEQEAKPTNPHMNAYVQALNRFKSY